MRLRNSVALAGLIAGAAAQGSKAGSSIIYQLSNNTEFAFIYEEQLALSNNFGANTGEVLRAITQITDGDFESWYREWNYLAEAIHGKAVKINETRFPVSAREAYFRSASYYRSADFFLHGNVSDPRIYTLWDEALADFDKATSLLDVPAERHNLTASNFSVPVIFFGPQSSSYPEAGQPMARGYGGRRGNEGGGECKKEKLPTIIVGTGYDGSQEELYHTIGRSIVERGWNYISYEGPGQPTVRRQQQLGFIPQWWEVVTPIVDYLHTRDDVDTERIALIGVSFGGALAPIAASREHRLAAMMAIEGITDMQEGILSQLPTELVELYTSGNQTAFDYVMLELAANASTPTQLRWVIDQSLWAFNTRSPFDWMTQLGDYKVTEDMIRNFTGKVFVGQGEDDSTTPTAQPDIMAGWAGDAGSYNLWKSDLGAGEHCQIGAEAQLAQVSLDWLADVFEGIAVPRNVTDEVE